MDARRLAKNLSAYLVSGVTTDTDFASLGVTFGRESFETYLPSALIGSQQGSKTGAMGLARIAAMKQILKDILQTEAVNRPHGA